MDGVRSSAVDSLADGAASAVAHAAHFAANDEPVDDDRQVALADPDAVASPVQTRQRRAKRPDRCRNRPRLQNHARRGNNRLLGPRKVTKLGRWSLEVSVSR
jgi:hypothetical protein